MFDKLKSLDTDLMIFLNNLGSEQFDFLWLAITNKYTWIPFYLYLIYLYFNSVKLKPKSIFVFFVVIGLMILFMAPLAKIAAGVAIAWGVWTIWKSE